MSMFCRGLSMDPAVDGEYCDVAHGRIVETSIDIRGIDQ